MTDTAAMARLVDVDLAAQHASTAADLVTGAAPRALHGGVPAVRVHSNGRVLMVGVVLDRGPLPVAVELSLQYILAVDDAGRATVSSRPSRDDLVTATKLALAGEQRAFDAATAALDKAGKHPPGASWRAALHAISLDPRLPAAEFAASPATWSLFFEPYGDHGWTFVLLDAASFAPVTVQP